MQTAGSGFFFFVFASQSDDGPSTAKVSLFDALRANHGSKGIRELSQRQLHKILGRHTRNIPIAHRILRDKDIIAFLTRLSGCRTHADMCHAVQFMAPR